jgi:hypothetical protein
MALERSAHQPSKENMRLSRDTETALYVPCIAPSPVGLLLHHGQLEGECLVTRLSFESADSIRQHYEGMEVHCSTMTRVT